jgi:hypothetical protein
MSFNSLLLILYSGACKNWTLNKAEPCIKNDDIKLEIYKLDFIEWDITYCINMTKQSLC